MSLKANKYEEAIDVIARYISDSKRGVTRYSENTINQKLSNLKEIVDKATPKKAEIRLDVRPEYGENGAYVDADVIVNYHCPVCGEWLSCDAALEPDKLDMYCSMCGQYVKGVEADE